MANYSDSSTYSTASASSGGFLGGDRIQATMVFERIRFK